MKKVLCFVLTLIIALTIPVTVMADNDGKCHCDTAPVIYVRGFGGAIYKTEEDGSRTNAFAADEEKVTAAIDDIIITVFALLTGNADLVAKGAAVILDAAMGDLYCTYSGESIKEIIPAESDPANVDKHKNYRMDASTYDRQNAIYEFEYDWRLDPLVIAEDLNTYIEEIKATTGHDKVVIKCHSEGNCIAAAYLYKFGYNSVEKLCFTAAAFNGINLVGQLFTKDLSLENKGTEIADFIASLMRGGESEEIITPLMYLLNDIGLINGVGNLLHKLLIGDVLDALYEEVLIDFFATWPALWTFVPDSYYEKAKEVMFRGETRYDILEEKIDEYHYNVQNKLDSILKEAKAQGVDIVVFSQYNFAPIPVYDEGLSMSDMLVETKYSSFGATTAPYGKTLNLDFNSPDAKYYSKDKMIDASTCLFPEYTWFIRGVNHAVNPEAYLDFTDWAILYDGQPTVFTDPDHPQFVYMNAENKLVPVEGEVPYANGNNFINFVKALFNA